MPSVRIGAKLQQLQPNADTPRVNSGTTGDTVTRTFNLRRDRVKAVLDSIPIGTQDNEWTSSYLLSKDAVPIGSDESIVTLVYGPLGTAEQLPPVGTVTQEIDANPMEVPITLGNDEAISEAAVALHRKNGIEAFLKPQPIYRRVEILNSFDFDETDFTDGIGEVILTVGKIDNSPEGITNPSTGTWLKVGYVARTVGDKYEKTETWQYASNGWDATIYDSIA